MDKGIIFFQIHPVRFFCGFPTVPESQVSGLVMAKQQAFSPSGAAEGGDGVHTGFKTQIQMAEAKAVHAKIAAFFQHGGEIVKICGVSAVSKNDF